METEIERVNRRYSVERDNHNYYESKNYNKKRDIEKLEDDKKTLQLDIEKLKRVNEKLEDDLRSEKRKFEASEDSNKRLKCAVDDTARTINRLREELFDTVRHNNRNQHCIIMYKKCLPTYYCTSIFIVEIEWASDIFDFMRTE